MDLTCLFSVDVEEGAGVGELFGLFFCVRLCFLLFLGMFRF